MKNTKKVYGIGLALALTSGLAATLEAQDMYVESGNGTIGEYGLDGSVVNASLITGLDFPNSIAISGNDMFVVNYLSGIIGEYTTSGATVNASLITGMWERLGRALSLQSGT